MPIEIKELVIKATVSQNQKGADGSNTSSSGSGSRKQKGLVEECVAQVMEILRKEKER